MHENYLTERWRWVYKRICASTSFKQSKQMCINPCGCYVYNTFMCFQALIWISGDVLSLWMSLKPEVLNRYYLWYRGLIYKTFMCVGSLIKVYIRTKAKRWQTAKKIDLKNKACSLYNSQITCKCAYVNHPQIPPVKPIQVCLFYITTLRGNWPVLCI